MKWSVRQTRFATGLALFLTASTSLAGQRQAGFHLSLSHGFFEWLLALPQADDRYVNDIIQHVGVWGKETLAIQPRIRFRNAISVADVCLDATAVAKAETYEPTTYATVYRTTTSRLEGNKCLQLSIEKVEAPYATASERTTSQITRIDVKPAYDYDRAYRYTQQKAEDRRFDFERSRGQQSIYWLEIRLDTHPLMTWIEGGIVQAFFETFKVLDPSLSAGFSTSPERIAFDSESKPGVTAAPPPLPSGDIVLRTHAGTVNKFASYLAGKTLSPQSLKMPGAPPEDGTPATAAAAVGITFAAEDPITVTFEDGSFGITIRLASFSADNHSYGARHIRFKYQVVPTDDGLVLNRVGKIDVLPPGYRDGDVLTLADRLIAGGVREQLNPILAETMTLANFDIPLPDKRMLKLKPKTLSTKQGWLSLAFVQAE